MAEPMDQASWLVARDELLQAEKELTRAKDALAKTRRELPELTIIEPYSFDTVDGERSLADCLVIIPSSSSITSCLARTGPKDARAVPIGQTVLMALCS